MMPMTIFPNGDTIERTTHDRKNAMRRSVASGPRVTIRSSGTASADLVLAQADEAKTKMQLAIAVNGIFRERGLTQKQAALLLHITQPKVSALAHYRLGGFSVERLMNFVTALGRDVEIVIRRPRSHRAPRIHVTAA